MKFMKDIKNQCLLLKMVFGAYDKLENGIINDDYRIDYLRNHISEMKKSN